MIWQKRLITEEVLKEWIDTYGDQNYVDYKLRASIFREMLQRRHNYT